MFHWKPGISLRNIIDEVSILSRKRTRIAASPRSWPTTRPLASTVATASSELVNTASDVTSRTEPSEKCASTTTCCVWAGRFRIRSRG